MSSLLPSDQNEHKKKKTDPFGDIMKSMNDFFNEKPVKGFLQSIDDFFSSPFPPGPAFQVKTTENGKEFIIAAELPGVKKEQIQLNTLGNHLTISIHNHQMEMEENEQNTVIMHRQYRQHSSRTISLPYNINEKKIKATYRDGLLQIRIPQEKGKIIDIEE